LYLILKERSSLAAQAALFTVYTRQGACAPYAVQENRTGTLPSLSKGPGAINHETIGVEPTGTPVGASGKTIHKMMYASNPVPPHNSNNTQMSRMIIGSISK
jgi:hypothetical protein